LSHPWPLSFLSCAPAISCSFPVTSRKKKEKPWVGKLAEKLFTPQGSEAARGIAIDLLATLHAALGDLNRITGIAKLLVLVNSAPTFTEQHLVANGASELFLEIFGEQGPHARSAFGVAQIPLGSCVEIELVAEVADPGKFQG
jgi:enamine deaminase RidA (YjgF/YER057c/UK114 family)